MKTNRAQSAKALFLGLGVAGGAFFCGYAHDVKVTIAPVDAQEGPVVTQAISVNEGERVSVSTGVGHERVCVTVFKESDVQELKKISEVTVREDQSLAKRFADGPVDTFLKAVGLRKRVISDNQNLGEFAKRLVEVAQGFLGAEGLGRALVDRYNKAVQENGVVSNQVRILFGELEQALTNIAQTQAHRASEAKQLKALVAKTQASIGKRRVVMDRIASENGQLDKAMQERQDRRGREYSEQDGLLKKYVAERAKCETDQQANVKDLYALHKALKKSLDDTVTETVSVRKENQKAHNKIASDLCVIGESQLAKDATGLFGLFGHKIS